MEVTMSSVYRLKGPSYLFDNDNTTMAHTSDNMLEAGWINLRLNTPQPVAEVLVMGRHDHSTKYFLKRLDNTVIETTDESDITKECGKVILKEYKASIIVRVTCKEVRKVVNVKVIASKPEFSINIAELRICNPAPFSQSKYLKLIVTLIYVFQKYNSFCRKNLGKNGKTRIPAWP